MIEKCVFISEKTINPELLNREKQIYILSTDLRAKSIFFLLLQYCVKVTGFIAKDLSSRPNRIYGLRVFDTDELESGRENIFISDRNNQDFFERDLDPEFIYWIDPVCVSKNGFQFIENEQIRKCNAALMLTMIISRAQKRQPVFCIKSEDSEFWGNLLEVLGNEVRNAIIISVDNGFDKIYDLMYSDIDKIIFFICLFEYREISETLIELGFKQTLNFVYIHNSFNGTTVDKYCGFDWYLGNSFKMNDGVPGFYICGDQNKAQKRIVLLGNSATDPLFYPQKSWAEMFWEKCRSDQIDTVIYNGAVTDYNSSNELIKLLRDGLLLEPDIVVSYSGFIDFREYVSEYPYINLNLMRTSEKWEEETGKEVVFGIKDKRSAYERWIKNEEMMYQICQMHGIAFYGILQPWIGSECGEGCEKLQIWSDNYWQVSFPQFDRLINNAREFISNIKFDVAKKTWLYDFTHIFSEIDDTDIYFDSIHVNERGNQIIAQEIKKVVQSKIEVN